MYFLILIELRKALWNCLTGSCKVNSVSTIVIHWTKIRMAEAESWIEVSQDKVFYILWKFLRKEIKIKKTQNLGIIDFKVPWFAEKNVKW